MQSIPHGIAGRNPDRNLVEIVEIPSHPFFVAVQFHPGIGNVTNHFFILASEAAAGQWEIRWSVDMSEVYEYGITHEEEPVENGGQE